MKTIHSHLWILTGFSPACSDPELQQKLIESVKTTDVALLIIDGKIADQGMLLTIVQKLMGIVIAGLMIGNKSLPSASEAGIYLPEREISVAPNCKPFSFLIDNPPTAIGVQVIGGDNSSEKDDEIKDLGSISFN